MTRVLLLTCWLAMSASGQDEPPPPCRIEPAAGRPSQSLWPAPAIRFREAYGPIAATPEGRLYVGSQQRIFRIEQGLIWKFAGNDEYTSQPSPDGQPALATGFSSVRGLLAAPDGSLYVIEQNRVRRIRPDSVVETVAGTGEEGFSGDLGPATEARLRAPGALFLAPDGSLLIADTGNYRIRRVNADGVIDTIAGTGGGDPSVGEGGPAYLARLGEVTSLAQLDDGTIYFFEGSGISRLRAIQTDGILRTVSGRRDRFPSTPDPDDVPLSEATHSANAQIAVSADGRIFMLDSRALRELMPDQTLRVIRPAGPQPPGRMALVSADWFYLHSAGSRLIEFHPSSGEERLIAGGNDFLPVDGLPAAAVSLEVRGIDLGADGSVYLLDQRSQAILRVRPDGTLETYFQQMELHEAIRPDPAYLDSARRLQLDAAGRVYFLNGGAIYRIEADKTVTRFAGGGTNEARDYAGPASEVKTFFAEGRLGFGADGSVVAYDRHFDRILRISPEGTADTLWRSNDTPLPAPPPGRWLSHQGTSVSIRADGTILLSGKRGIAEFRPGVDAEPRLTIVEPGEGLNQVYDFFEEPSGDVYYHAPERLSMRRPNGEIRRFPVAHSEGRAEWLSADGTLVPSPGGDLYLIRPYRDGVDVLRNYRSCPSVATPVLTLTYADLEPFRSGIAPGTPLTLRGLNLGPFQEEVMAPDAEGRLPREVGGLRILVGGIAAPILSAQSYAVRFQIPYGAAPGDTPITAVYQGESSVPVQLTVVPVALGPFPSGIVQPPLVSAFGALDTLVRNEDGSLNAEANPARAGTMVSVQFYGVGELAPPRQPGEVALDSPRKAAARVAVFSAGQYPEIAWSGEVPGKPGLYQVNFLAPPGVGPHFPSVAAAGSFLRFPLWVTAGR